MKYLKRFLIPVLVLFVLFSAVSCTAGPNSAVGTNAPSGEPAGFWMGLWHGFIFLFTFIVSLFNDNVSVYEVHNRGHLYDLGFLLGVMCFFGGSGGGAAKKRRKSSGE